MPHRASIQSGSPWVTSMARDHASFATSAVRRSISRLASASSRVAVRGLVPLVEQRRALAAAYGIDRLRRARLRTSAQPLAALYWEVVILPEISLGP